MDVTLSTFAIDYWVLPYVQAEITSVKAAGGELSQLQPTGPKWIPQ